MSRASAGSFADFFPNAPAVLQQKQKKGTLSSDSRSDLLHQSELDGSSSSSARHHESGGSPDHYTLSNPPASAVAVTSFHTDSITQAEDDVPRTAPGDLLNGVGSASSHASTASSIFSNSHPHSHNMTSSTANNGGVGAFNSASALTPLTNGDSSPPTKITSPRSAAKMSSTERSRAASPSSHVQSGSGTTNTIRPEEKAITPIPTPPETKRQARPGPGEAKGFRCVYDPDLDKKLHGSERKKRKVHYREFGKETEHPAPPDPRLGIARYTLGAYHPKDSKSKTRLRPAPYLVKPYAFDPKISIGPGPATQVVVTGFDPFTPESQIRTLLGSYGEIAHVENRTDPSTGSFVGVCLVRYRDSKPARGPHVSAAGAARRAEKEGTGQRIGVRQVKIDRDREGHRTNRLVEAAVRRNRKAMEKVMAFENPIVTSSTPTPKPTTTTPATPIEGPPPGAPKGPSGRPPPLGPRSSATARPTNSLVEQEPVLDSLKREPYIFIAHCYVPVLGTTVPHLQRRMRMYHIEKVRCDKTGYYIIFQTSSRDPQWGPNEAARCYHETNMKELFNCYVMNMELQQYGNPNYERSPTPERVEAERKEKEEKEQIEREEQEDLEFEKQERAVDLDPVCGALERLRTQLKEKILDDIKTRIAVPTLYDFMDPERHAAKRRKLGISDPLNNENKRPALYFGKDDDSSAAATPRSGVHGFASGPRRKPLAGYDMNAARNRHSLQPERLNAFADERRKKPPPRHTAIRPLFHRLQDFYHEDESDEERQASTARDTEDQESRPLSRMSRSSTPEQDEDDLEVPQSKKRRTERSEAGWGHESDDEGLDAAGRELLGHLIHKEIEDMANRELEQVVMTLPRSSKLHKRAQVEILLRKKYAEDDELFGISTPEQKADDTTDEVTEKVSLVDNKVDPNDDAQHQKTASNFNINLTLGAAPKTKKKTKKQLQEERDILKAAAKAMVEEEPAHKDVNLKEELVRKAELLKEPIVKERAEVEWGLSTETPRRTVEDDPKLVLDLDGWQHLVKDDEDLKFLQGSLKGVKPRDLGDIQLWAWNQKQIKDLNAPLRQAQPKAHQTTPSKSKARQAAKQQAIPVEAPRTLRQPIRIEGYYVPNSTGCARTEGVHKILNSEKSKYLPHRIRVQKEREERQNEAKKDPSQTAKLAAAAKATATQTSRTNRANTRRMVNDINTQKQAGGLGADSDAVRFNQLKKRKKLVKFDRSAIHNWGLYAEENIQAGDMIIEYVGEKIRHILSQVREARYVKQGIGSSYLFRIDDDMVIDATKKGGIARFINHSCSPNCTAKIINVEKTKRIVIYALRDIGKGEELTYDYKFEREIGNPDRIPCLCGSVNCKGFLN